MPDRSPSPATCTERGLAFHAYSTRRLRRAGIAGTRMRVELEGPWLTITGEQGGRRRIALAAVKRMRTGFSEGQTTIFYQTVIWPSGERPIGLAPVREDWPAYAAFVRELAGRIAATHGLGAVERGESMIAAMLPAILMGLVFAGALGTAIFALADEGSALRWMPPVIPGAAFAFLAWRFHSLHRPRAVRNLAELDRQLPH